MPFAAASELIAAIGQGKMVVLVDDEDRENEGDLVMAADAVEEEHIAFMAREGRGLICLALEGTIVDHLNLPMMVGRNKSRMGTNFTVSIEAASGVTTGISAADRAHTIRVAVAPNAKPDEVVSPGHIFPLRAMEGGVLVRAGQTEGSVDLARLSGRTPAGVICEIMREDGRMARRPELEVFCQKHGLLLGSVADLIAWRERTEMLVETIKTEMISTPHGACQVALHRSLLDDTIHTSYSFGAPLQGRKDPVLVRVQRAKPFAELLGLSGAANTLLPRLAKSGGVLVLLQDRSISEDFDSLSANKTDHADQRAYGIGAQILRSLGVRQMRLISACARVPSALAGHGLEITQHEAL